MDSEFANVYEDDHRASAYAQLAFPGTYYLAFRDLPDLLGKYAVGRRALDFGCGTGRSSRFLQGHGFDVVGVDISAAMLERARSFDPTGDYRLVTEDTLREVEGTFDVILSAFTFDNIPTLEQREKTFATLRTLLSDGACILSVVSSPEIYVNEWASFSTRDYPENRQAKSGDRVRIVMLDVPDARPVEDVVCFEDAYRAMYAAAHLSVRDVVRPLATGQEPIEWKRELEVAPWTIYVLSAASER